MIAGGTILGVPYLDPLAGLVVSGMILKAGIETGYGRYIAFPSPTYIASNALFPYFRVQCSNQVLVMLHKLLCLFSQLSAAFVLDIL